MNFRLFFVNQALVKISYNNIVLQRGKSSYENFGSFQWTEAVKALCYLLLNYKLNNINSISGSKGSKSSSLDYALSKPPVWIQELFGISGNTDILRRLFHRINPEGKNSSPTTIVLNRNLISPEQIEIFNNYTSASITDLRNLLDNLSENFDNFNSKLEKIYQDEANLSLSDSSLFLDTAYNSKVKDCFSNKSVERLARDQNIFNKLSHNRICQSFIPNVSLPELEFASTYSQAGTLAIFNNLKSKFNIKINSNFPYAVPLANSIIDYNYEPDVCCLGIAPAIKILNHTNDYIPLMLGPRITHQVLQSEQCFNSPIHMVKDDPTTGSFCLEQLIENKKINKNIKIIQNEPDEIHYLAKNNSLTNSLLWFPHYNLLDNGQFKKIKFENEMFQYCLILIHRRHLGIHKQINHVIKNSWYELLDLSKLKEVTSSYVNNEFSEPLRKYTWN